MWSDRGSLVTALPRYTLAVVPSIEIHSPSLTVTVFLLAVNGELLAVFVNGDGAGADDTRPAHAARDHCGVARLTADRGQDALGNVHTVNIVGGGFLAHQDHRTGAAHLDRVFCREGDSSNGSAGAGIDSRRDVH